MTTALLVRLTPELHDLVGQGAELEDSTRADFMRDAAIFRLGQLGLVEIVSDDVEVDVE